MGWSYARVDFLPDGAYCIFCGRELKTKKGIVVRQSDGREAFSGPGCAKSKMGDPKERLLDVASMALLVVEGRRGEVARSGPSSAASPAQQNELRPEPGDETNAPSPSPPPTHLPAVEYLRLRYEVMGDFNGNVTAVMRQAYWDFSRNGVLSPDAEGLLLGVMRKSAIDNSVFSDRNIRRCIGLEYWLKLALQNTRPDRRDYLNSMLDTLHYEWSLSPGQIDAINKWGKGLRKTLPSFPKLSNKSFAGVRRPDFMIRNREARS
ncbi:MAG: hypothetical protein CMK74_04080 [Pseudomonadales bacterium]|nr:hypothetical protein [Pseudomonadales bacterium]|tara:strand:+ start:7595 stop:8383 length:789 start_codon:yes stop_codon:yes gene_type:complete